MKREPNLDQSTALRLLESLHGGGVLIALYDREDVVRYANLAFRESFMQQCLDPVDFPTVLRTNHRDGVGADLGPIDVETYILRACKRRRSKPYCAFPVDMVDGRRLWLTEALLPGNWLLCVATDITVLKHSEAALRTARDAAIKASQTDSLTKLPNRRYGLQFIKRALDNAHVYREPLSVAFLDIDHFKQINDQFGHDAGDAALRKFADICRAKLRASDMIARVGGEEFVIVWTGAPLEIALGILRRLHEEPIRIHHSSGQVAFTFTFSAGITEVRSDDAVRSLLARTDKLLYAAKRKGRNAIEVALQ